MDWCSWCGEPGLLGQEGHEQCGPGLADVVMAATFAAGGGRRISRRAAMKARTLVPG